MLPGPFPEAYLTGTRQGHMAAAVAVLSALSVTVSVIAARRAREAAASGKEE